MSEKYFEWTIYFLLICAILLPVLIWRLHMRLHFLQNLVRIGILKRQQKSNFNLLFSADILNKSVRILFFRTAAEAKHALRALTGGNTAPAVAFLQKKQPALALLLLAHTDINEAYKQSKRRHIPQITDRKYGVYIPLLAHLVHDRHTMLAAVEKITPQLAKYDRTAQAYFKAVAAYAYLHEGDMLSASQNASAALKFFQKKQFAAETAACHLILAEIYRISCVNDVAQTMIESALKIYQTQNTPLFLAKAHTIKGMLMVFENRFEEAEAEYQKALQLPLTPQLHADISNQLALLKLAQDDTATAANYVRQALDMQKRMKNPYGTAFSLQLSAHIHFQKKQHRLTVKTASEACNLYLKQKNFSAAAECLYLAAEAQYKMRCNTLAEKNLREILQINRAHPNSFHTANAYSLLGLIYLQKKDLQRAKVLFQQSLHLEQSHRRCEGLAADYANLAFIDELTDYADNAASNWQIALEYANETGDKELVALIEKHRSDR